MSLTQNSRLIFLIFFASIALALAFAASAQEETTTEAEPVEVEVVETLTEEEVLAQDAEAEQLVEQDEDITASDLGVGDPTILPGNPLYVFKGISRGFRSLITFDPVKKAELKLKFANEKIIEAKKLEDQGADDDRLKRALDNYGREVARVKDHIERLEDHEDTTGVENIVKQAADSQIKHHKLLGRFLRNHTDIAPEIEERKAEALQVLIRNTPVSFRSQSGSASELFHDPPLVYLIVFHTIYPASSLEEGMNLRKSCIS